MAIFQYIASNAQGRSIRGTLPAANRTEVAKKLHDQGLFLVSCKSAEKELIEQARPAESAPLVQAQGWWTTWKANLTQSLDPTVPPRGQIPLKELTVLTRQISISIRAGMSFVNALERMTQRAKNPRTAGVLRHILDAVLSGKKFSEALSQHPTIFNPVYVSMVAAGEAGGFLSEALDRVAVFLESEIDLNSKIKSAMIYPLTIAVAATLMVSGLMAFVIPVFVKVFQDMGMALPLPTRILIGVSHFFRHGGFLLPLVLVGIFVGLKKWRLRNEPFRCLWDEQVLRIPLFGKLITLGIITRFIRTLSSLVSNGVTIVLAINVSRQVVQNRAIEIVVDDLFSSVQQGNGLSPVLYKSKYFPELVSDMVATGESTGTIPEVLDKMADYYDAEVATTVRDILTMVEPLMIMVMAVIVGLIIAGLMLPMFGMPSGIGQ